MFATLFAFFSRRKLQESRPLNDLLIIMYTRHGCHLCDEAWDQLRQQQPRYHFRLEKQDVDTDSTLVELYGKCVPVVIFNDKVRFRGGVNPVLLKRLLARMAV
jgi:hypothetical protein